MTNFLEVIDLKKNFGRKEVLCGVTFSLSPGEIVAFLGPNGAGKSTTIKIIMGLRRLDAGQLRLFGESKHSARVQSLIGYTSQDLSFPQNLRLQEVLRFVSSHFPNPRPLRELAEEFGLQEHWSTAVGGLSGGEKRRLGLACALVGRPQLLILDEPSTGLDVESRRELWLQMQAFRASGGSVLLSTHDLTEAGAIADRVLLMDSGQILVQGTVNEIQRRIEYKKVSYMHQHQIHEELTRDSDQFVRELVQNKPDFSELTIHPVTLEEAFLKIRGTL